MSLALTSASVARSCHQPTPGAPRGPRILVFGCARSGTTLLLNLLRTFDGIRVRDGEHCVGDLLDDPHPGWVAVKRTPYCAEHLVADLPVLRSGVWIIDIIRDPRDVVTSVLEPFPGYYCGYERWDRDVRVSEFLAGRHLRYVRIRYEELVHHPDDLQDDLASILGLRPRTAFSDFVRLVPRTLPRSAVRALGGVRDLDPSGVGRWRQRQHTIRVREQMSAHPRMEETLRWMGYPPSASGEGGI